MTRNVLGARGIDRISITENSATTHGYPLYDGHGNCRAILTKNGTGYGTGNWRTYDVWGSVRSGSATGDPKSRYVASIGHVADDESSLIYMRARYYEPATGRFLSQDPALDGRNWFIYCSNEPVASFDNSGTVDASETARWIQDILQRAGELGGSIADLMGTPALLILQAGAGAIASLEAWAARTDKVSALATTAGLTLTPVVAQMPWLPSMLFCVANVARSISGGLRFAALLLAFTTTIAFMLALSTDAY